MSTRGHIHAADAQWMDWLRTCSKRKGVSGRTLYEEYSTGSKTQWDASILMLKTEICPGWKFCRGHIALSSSDIAAARHRYLDRYPLTYEDRDSGTYIDTLLEVDSCQTQLRQRSDKERRCQGCIERDGTIEKLKLALAAKGITDATSITNQMMTSIFHRYFILDGGHTSRTEIRKTMEQVIQQEISADESLPCSSSAWSTFLRNTLGVSGASSKPIRCRRRAHPLADHDVA